MLQLVKKAALYSCLASFAVLSQPVMADMADKTMKVAISFGPKSSVPDPRARMNGWLSNRAGVSETLIGLSYQMEMEPRLAVSYKNLSSTEWQLNLRPDVKFHDGSGLTAQSVITSFNKMSEKDHPAHNPRLLKLLDLAGIEAKDDLTLIFKTNKPNSAFLWSLTEASAVVMKEGTKDLPLIGTGPFIFQKAVTDKTYQVRAFKDYWGGKPKLDAIHFDVIVDSSVAALAMQAGDIDLVTLYPEPDFAALKSEKKGQLFSNATTRLFFFQAQTQKGPLAYKAVRQAFSLGLDRKLIVEAVLAGVGGEVAQGIFPPNMTSWFNPALSLPYNPEKAKTLLDQAGFKDMDGNGIREVNGQDIILQIRSYEGRAALKPTLEITQALLKKIGIGAEISMGEFAANNEAMKNGEIDMHLQAWGTAPQGDPDYFPNTLTKTGASYNVGNYHNDHLDQLLEKGRSEFSDVKRKGFYDQIQVILNDDLPLIPVFHKKQLSVGNGRVQNYRIHPAETYMASPELDLSAK